MEQQVKTLPVSFAQQRLWFLAQLDARANAAYHMPGGVRLRGTVDRPALQRALDRIVERHEILRTRFVTRNGQPRQRILDEAVFALQYADLGTRPDADTEADAKRIAHEEAAAPFDLERGPLIRGRLLRLAEDDHILLVTMHHIVSDAWSMDVLLDELSSLYAAYKAGAPDPLPALSIQYADYAIWQRKHLTGEVQQQQVSFWRKTFTAAPTLLELPTDRPRPPVQNHAGASVAFELDEALSGKLRALSERHDCTLFMTLLAAWSALLSRLSGQEDLVIGTPVAGRVWPEIEPLIGFFVNTLALRVDLSGNPSVATLLRRVRGTTLAAQDHQDLPFEQVIEAVQPVRNLAHNPLFQVMFTLHRGTGGGNLQMPGLELEPVHQEPSTAEFDLALSMHEGAGRIGGQVTYATSLFDGATIERHIGYYTTLLRAMATDDARALDTLPWLTAQERAQVLHGWNATDVPFPSEGCLHELFEAKVQGGPYAAALVFDGGALSYAELDAEANRLAHRLIARGVRRGDCVALALPRTPQLVIAELAVLKCGAAYVPLDLQHPAERLRFIVADCRAQLLVCRADCALELPDLLQLDIDSVDDEAPCAKPFVHVHAEDAAYVMYTSGSTGTPKGVVVPHRAVINLALHGGRAHFDTSDRVAFLANPAFDASTFELWATLLTGAALVVIDQATLLEPQALAQRLRDDRVTIAHLTAGLLPAWSQTQTPGALSSGLRCLLTGGDRVDTAAAARIVGHGSLPQLVHCYGPTETTTFAVMHEVSEVLPEARSIPLGRPIPNARIYVLDARGEPVPVGVPGEIHIGGAGLAHGYLNQPELTAQRFVPDPYAAQQGTRMYQTGDLGRWLADGTLEFLGRNDQQIKIRGFRIEPGEIEARLLQQPQVREAVVLAREDTSGDKRLVAYVVGDARPETLRDHLAAHLPEYMVPAAYVQLDALPLTPNGKLDRAALPAPDDLAFGARHDDPPQGELECALAAIWSELLGVERIGRRDDFFLLGGHSLLAVQLVSRIRMQLGFEVPLADLFAHPTLARYAERVAVCAASVLPPITITSRSAALPLSFAQQRLWFIGLQARARAAYVIPTGVRLRGTLHVPAVRAALDRIVARHEALRTSFASVEGSPVQVIGEPDVGFALEQLDLASHADPEAELERIAAEEATAPFDLERGPLIRGRLLRLAADDHVLLVTVHHIVSDGWSASVLINEFSALYAAFSQGRPDPLPALAVQYADYAAWQRRWITGDVLRRQLDFWLAHLSGAPAQLELPTDRPRPPVQDYAGSSIGFALDAELSAGLRTLSHRHGTTLFMTLIASWAALLSRLSRQDELVIGTPVAHRTRAELEPLIGFFVNALALRIDLSGSPTVADLLAQVRATALAAQAHQDVPFEQIVEALNPPRSTAHGPVFQVMFAWQNAPEGSLEMPGLQLQSVGSPSTAAQFDLEVSMHDDGTHIVGDMGYASALFDESTVQRHIAHWKALLRAMVADETTCVAHLPLLSAQERHTLLQTFNATAADFRAPQGIHQLFEAQAERTPKAIALVSDDGALSYAELNAQANGLAHHLRGLGVGPDDRVAICLERGAPLVVGLLAILKAGGGYVPLDADYPAERLAFMLADSVPRVLLTQARLRAALPWVPEVVDLDDPGAWQHQPDANPVPAGLTGSHLAYVFYTSGSTGTPKGVQVAHASVVNYARAAADAYALTPSDRVLQASSVSFDIAVDEIFTTLGVGATLVLSPWPRLPSIAEFTRLVERQQLTVLNLPTAYWHEWVAALDESVEPLAKSLRLVVVGGEAASAQRHAQWRQHAGDRIAWINCYGPTETTAGVSFGRVAPGEPMHIGRPTANTRIYLLDAWGEPVPQGVAGEIHIGGAQVARGYLNRQELTAQRFIPDPYSGEPGARMFRTGDLGRWRPDGTIECLGRNDAQVKIRGFRIEPGEIEARLRDHPEVLEAVVLAREDSPGDKRLVAYVVGDEAPPAALRDHLAAQLPEYMVPTAYVHLDALPLTPAGKLDRRALPAPGDEACGDRDSHETPQGEPEITLAAIWRELLGVDRIGRHDDFFELGGHSLLAVQLASRIRAKVGVDVELAELFENATLASFAERVAAAGAAELPAIVPASRAGSLPLSFAQRRLWFLTQLDERASVAYLVPGAVRLVGALNVPALQAALDGIVARHEALRTCFGLVDGTPAQIIQPPGMGLALVHIDLWAHAQPQRELDLIVEEEATTPFDLARGPLIRGRLVRMADEDHVLLVTMHHIVSDGWSMGVLLNELSALYAAHSQGRDDPLPPLAVQYADYAVWQRQWITGEVLQRQLDFWRQHLSGAPALLELPTDRPRPAVQDFVGASLDFQLDEALTAGLKALSRRHGTTLFMTLLAAWAALLSRLSGQAEVVIGTPVANRMRPELEPLIGFFINTMALRVDVSGNPTVAELLAQVRATALAAQSHQDIPFEQVVETLNPQRSLAHSPVFQVLFAWQNAPEGSLELPGLDLHQAGSVSSTVKFDLDVSMQEAGDRIGGGFQYATALFDAATIERHLGHWQTLLRAMVANDAHTVGRLPLLSGEQRQQLLHGWNCTEAAFPSDRCIHELFEEQAERTPQACAVSDGDRSLSYCELNAKANRLAHRLIAMGVRLGDCVALALPRSADLVIAELAVLKCGAAYVPLDLEQPAQRLRFLLDDCGAPLLICHNDCTLDAPARLELDRLDADGPDDYPHVQGRPEDAAYVMYTSGSTGAPKGVVVPHRAVLNLVFARDAALGADDRVAFASNPAFDSSTLELWGALLKGAAVVVVPPPVLLDPRALAERLQRERVTALILVAGVLRAYAPVLAGQLPTLRTLITGGDVADTNALAMLLRKGSPQQVLQTYGPTETTQFVTTLALREPPAARVCIPIGRPIANARLYLLDALGQPTPVGVAGEIHIGGASVAHGYLNRPGLTAERFVPDPFATQAGARMYKTGDLGRWRPDGTIEFLRRNDHQVKIRGFRIEPGEIEARLIEHPQVNAAVVLAREDDSPDDKRLVAYVMAEDSLSHEAMRAHLAAQLPEYMVPAAFVRLDVWPLTPNGKLDRRALPAPEDGAFGTQAYEVPRGEVETTLAAIWTELLGIERIGRHDNFFELGGHSLLAVSLIERMRRLGWQLEVRSLFISPTLAGLAATVQTTCAVVVPPNLIDPDCTHLAPELLPLVQLSQGEIDAIVAGIPGGAANVQDVYPLAPLQEGILFHHLLSSEGDTYLTPSLLAFDSRKALDRFMAAMQSVIDRHDILRTAIIWQGLSEPVQVVWRQARLPAEELVLEGDDIAAQLLARCDPRHSRIELREAPLLRAHVAQDPRHDRWLLCLLSHHIVGDHTSLELMVEEVQAHIAGQEHRLAPPLPFRNFVAQARLGLTREQHEAFFTEMLADIDEPTAPFGLLDVLGDGLQVHEQRLALLPGLARALRSHARRLGVSAASLFHLAWALVLARTSGRDDVVFGTVLFGRMQGGDGADRVLGLFMNTLPLRITLDSTGVEQALRHTHARLAQLLHHEHAPLSLAQRCSSVPPSQPLFSALLNYRHGAANAAHHASPPDPAWQGMELLHEEDRSNYPLALSVDDLGEGYSIEVQSDRRIDAAQVCGLTLRALEQLVQALQQAPASAVRLLDVIPPAEREQLLHGWNATSMAFPADRCIHQLFEEQVRRTPAALALVFEDTTLSYAELNARANRLAHHLIELGVQPDTCVAIALPRGVEMAVAVLAVLKAGGAYVPLDPGYPAERLAFMLADSAPHVLLTEKRMAPALGAPPSLRVLEIDAEMRVCADRPQTNPEPAALSLLPSHLAYVIYTSGSTGKPKGVSVDHAGLVARIRGLVDRYGFSPRDRVLQFATLAFDASVEELFCTLCAGATLVMRTNAWIDSAEEFWTRCAEAAVTVLDLPTRFLHQIIEQPAARMPPGLRLVIVGGEELPAGLLQQWGASRNRSLLNTYGPTEAIVVATAHEVDGHPTGSIGRPVPNARIYILNAQGEPAPVGVAGEIHIGGPGVARGYLNRPDITAERFVPDPYAAPPGERMYKTGDLGRWLAGGTIEFLGRNDHQLKIRGFRIELGEIEARLLQQPGVREAVVLAREDDPRDKRLVAYLTGDASVQPEALRAHLAVALPDYMLPAAFVQVDALPLTPSGKLDRRALPAPANSAHRSLGHEAPQNQIESALAKIWSQVLGVEQIEREGHFFELGGHSLLAVRLVSLARQRGFNLTLQDVYACPALRSQAQRLAGGDRPYRMQALVARRTGNALPLFVVPTGADDITYAFELGPHLNTDVPIYALPWPAEMPASMDALAAHTVKLMREVRPRGPYRVLGYSSGGLLAYAVAKRLTELDEPVEFLGLLDCDNPPALPIEETQEELTKRTLVGQLVALIERDKYREQADIQEAVRELEASAPGSSMAELVALCEASQAMHALAAQEQTSIAQFAASCARSAAYEALWPAYLAQPLPSPLKLHLFFATEGEASAHHLGWDTLLPLEQIEILPVPGTHMTMIEPPHITEVGRAISKALQATPMKV